MKTDGISPKLPQAPRACKLGLRGEKARTIITHSPSPVSPPRAQGHRAQAPQTSPEEPSHIEPSPFYARPQQAIQPSSRLPMLSFPSGEGTLGPSHPPSDGDTEWSLLLRERSVGAECPGYRAGLDVSTDLSRCPMCTRSPWLLRRELAI